MVTAMGCTTVKNLDKSKTPYLNPMVGDDLVWTDYKNVQMVSSLQRYDQYLGSVLFGGYRIDWVDNEKNVIFSKQFSESAKKSAFLYYHNKGKIHG